MSNEYPKMLYGADREDQIIVEDEKDESAARGKGYQSLQELEASEDKPKRGRKPAGTSDEVTE